MKIFKHIQWQLFFITLCVHGAVAILLATNTIVIPSSASDHLSYHQEATQIAQLLHSGGYTFGAVYGHHWYPLFVGILYAIFGVHMVVGVLFNAILTAFATILFFKILQSLNVSEKKSFWFSLITWNVYASLVYQSSMLLKEAWVVVLLLLILWLVADMIVQRRFSVGRFLVVLIAFIALRNIRFFIGFAAIAGFFTAWFFSYETTIRKRYIYGVSMLLVVSVASFVLTGDGIGKSVPIGEYAQPAYINNLREDYFKGGATTMHISVVKKETITVGSRTEERYKFSLAGISAAAINTFFGPFPSQLPLKQYVFAALDLVWWYPIFILATIGICSVPLRKSVPYLVTTAIIAAGVTVGADNLGALMRYRVPALVLFSLFAAIGYSVLQSKQVHFPVKL